VTSTSLQAPRVHPTAIVEEDVLIGTGTSIWDNVHVRGPSRIGRDCIVGEKSYIAYDVVVGDRVKINAHAYLPAGVVVEDGVMISAGTVFTNDRMPRATTPDLTTLRGSEPDDHTLPTFVREGATLGAGCTVGCGLEIGRFAMIGMGAVVTRSVPDFHLAVGAPARSVGAVCRCGQRLGGSDLFEAQIDRLVRCGDCARSYHVIDGQVTEPGGRR
jgi:UDP-2-acetamido-3-amino-2,3-dideoxy-glucuronate N-acetyltransferase